MLLPLRSQPQAEAGPALAKPTLVHPAVVPIEIPAAAPAVAPLPPPQPPPPQGTYAETRKLPVQETTNARPAEAVPHVTFAAHHQPQKQPEAPRAAPPASPQVTFANVAAGQPPKQARQGQHQAEPQRAAPAAQPPQRARPEARPAAAPPAPARPTYLPASFTPQQHQFSSTLLLEDAQVRPLSSLFFLLLMLFFS